MANRRGKCRSSDRFPLLGLQNHCGLWLQPWNQKTIASWRKIYDKPKQNIKKQRHHFASKGPFSQVYGLSNSHVWMWELDCEEGWAPKNWCFQTVVLEKILESPLDSKIKPVNAKGNRPWILIWRTDAEAEAPILWLPDMNSRFFAKDPDAGKDWRQEKRMTEKEMVRWHHWFNGHKLRQTLGDGEGPGSLACCSSWSCKESNMTWQVNNNDFRGNLSK